MVSSRAVINASVSAASKNEGLLPLALRLKFWSALVISVTSRFTFLIGVEDITSRAGF